MFDWVVTMEYGVNICMMLILVLSSVPCLVTTVCMLCPRLCLKRQVIDLLAEGYTLEQLDAQPPVKVEDW